MCLNLKEIKPPDNKERWLITEERRATKAREENAGKRDKERRIEEGTETYNSDSLWF